MNAKQARAKARILEQLEKIPIIELACKKAGIPRSTYYRWVNEDPKFKDDVEEAQNRGYLSINDVAESKLIQKINDGEYKAVIYWLESNHKRYLKPRKPSVVNNFIEEPYKVTVEFMGSNGKTYNSFEEYNASESVDEYQKDTNQLDSG
jgi:hypothetical protein